MASDAALAFISRPFAPSCIGIKTHLCSLSSPPLCPYTFTAILFRFLALYFRRHGISRSSANLLLCVCSFLNGSSSLLSFMFSFHMLFDKV